MSYDYKPQKGDLVRFLHKGEEDCGIILKIIDLGIVNDDYPYLYIDLKILCNKEIIVIPLH